MTKASRDTQKKEGRGGKENEKERQRKREREGERERERERRKGERNKDENRCSQLRVSVQGHTKERGIPKCFVQEHPKKAEREEGEGRGRKGTKVPADPNES